jgi:hypothetical protein
VLSVAGIKVKASVLVRAKRGAKFPAGSYAAALTTARASLERDTRRAFDTAADPVTGRPWPPRKHDYPHPPLVRTGVLQQEALKTTASAAVTGNSLTATVTSPPYAKYQAKGTRTIAARRFLGASIGTIAVLRKGLRKEGRLHALRVLRGRG